MSGDVIVDVVNIENLNVFVSPEARADVPEDILRFLKEQVERGASAESMKDIGYDEVPEPEVPVEPPTAEEQIEENASIAKRVSEQMVADIARSNYLRNVVHHVDTARKLEGFQTNHSHRPDRPAAVDTKQATELVQADESLKRACAHCALRTVCRLEGDLQKWIDVHPYKDEHKGARRPGSPYVKTVESRTKFLRALRKDPGAHCDPAKREQ